MRYPIVQQSTAALHTARNFFLGGNLLGGPSNSTPPQAQAVSPESGGDSENYLP